MSEFDVIVVGSGISGGWAAKELTERGLKVALIERGRNIEHGKDYITEWSNPWDMHNNGIGKSKDFDKKFGLISKMYPTINQYNEHFFCNFETDPYLTECEDPFIWARGYQLGGRSLVWGRQCIRFSDSNFDANKKDGFGIDWPIRYKDISPWYDKVEKFIGVSGSNEGLEYWPDGHYQPPFEMNSIEKHFKEVIEREYKGRIVTIGRTANLTVKKKGRSTCNSRSHCSRGCSFGAYFSSISSTLPAARKTGNLETICDAVAEKLIVDSKSGQVKSLQYIDAKSGERKEVKAKKFFLCASAFNSVKILLNSKSELNPNGLGNSSGNLGRYIMDHIEGAYTIASFSIFKEEIDQGKRPCPIIITPFANTTESKEFYRSYYYQCGADRIAWAALGAKPGIGRNYSVAGVEAGPWIFRMKAVGECLPRKENRVTLDENSFDRFGTPQLKIEFSYSNNDLKLMEDAQKEAVNMIFAAGGRVIKSSVKNGNPGSAIHEMGGARMGNDPSESVVNMWNQLHDAKNVYVTDGACMASSACQNPSLTYMALTARACKHAADTMLD